jgi:tRNA U34 5-methylaminomethyl-2-thiouridine-forming methyltransferase MnmC
MHSCPENIEETLSPKFSFTKYYKKLEAFSCPSHSMDVIFYDAFAPSKQPEVWSLSNLQKCAELLKPGGILVTYCASGQFKRDLKTADFEVQVLPGPLGKKEMTRGIKYARN